jgi:hypothetical protein
VFRQWRILILSTAGVYHELLWRTTDKLNLVRESR